ncbi:MAG: Ni/Fe-hydrogenase, b-type cytochrome subunit [Azospirillaceae bacterium]|nr:Ni/Fe-hydrogenase, b-type cytochrome subunit [Azospirillaceae bacterium]
MTPPIATPAESFELEPIADLSDADTLRANRQTAIYVYEAPVRLWHWINAAAIMVLVVTGFLIARPLPSMPGEAAFTFLMGDIRFAHFTAGYILAVGLIGRLYWACVGNHHARQMLYIPFWRRQYWRDVGNQAAWYLFMVKYPRKYVGHNPLSQLAMFGMFFLGALFMICTGFALYSQGEGAASWQAKLFGWVLDLAGNSQNLHTAHHFGLWLMVVFVMLHVYAAIREDIMSRQSIVSTMISGWRMFKDHGQ